MKRLILDFFRRWWYFLLILAALTPLPMVLGVSLSLAPFASICVLADSVPGVFRVVRTLPLTRREQAMTWWGMGVLLMPLLWLIPLGTGAAIFQTVHAHIGASPLTMAMYVIANARPAYAPWFAVAVQTWIGIGYSALFSVLAAGLPSQRSTGMAETIGRNVAAALLLLSIPGMFFLLTALPTNPASVAPWHWAVFAAVPALVVASLASAQRLVDRRIYPVSGNGLAMWSRVESGRGLTGAVLFSSNLIGRGVIALLVVAASQRLCMHWLTGLKSGSALIPPMLAACAIMLSGLCAEAFGMRTLRTLPLTCARLTALLMALPVAMGISAPVILAMMGATAIPAGYHPLTLVAQGVAIAGFGGLALATNIRMQSVAGLAVSTFLAMLVAFSISYTLLIEPWLLAAGAAALLAAPVLLWRGLRNSAACYRSRKAYALPFGPAMGGA